MDFQVAEKKFDPDLVVYNAGTDILDGDPLGRLKVRSTNGKQAICCLHVCHLQKVVLLSVASHIGDGIMDFLIITSL